MTDRELEAVVIGAGVVGLASAVYLQRSGIRAKVIDPQPPGMGASFGNAGLISPDSPVPIAIPGILRFVPGWLLDPQGPFSIKLGYFPQAAPWLLRWLRSSRMSRAIEISRAMRALHRDSLECWRDLLGTEMFGALIRQNGQVQVWETSHESATSLAEQRLRNDHGISTERLAAEDLRRMFPGISHAVRRGLLIPGNGHTVDPHRIVRTLSELFVAAGGEILAERVLAIQPRSDAPGYTIVTDKVERLVERAVLTAGAWSGELLKPLGIPFSMESERGYHAALTSPNIELTRPIVNKSRYFAMTSMDGGLRVTGNVEIAGLRAPPDERYSRRLAVQAKLLFPELRFKEARYWMGHRPSTPDSLPIVGTAAGHPNLFLAFGSGHFGMTGGPPIGRLVARLIAGEPPGIDLLPYSARRFAAFGARSHWS
jgi:glycine/D-amino acid oxidase-like deaminating enzyme